MRQITPIAILAFVALLGFKSCKKKPNEEGGPANPKLSYSDSVFYIKSQNYIVSPNINQPGTYSAFPDNLLIDPATGRITVAIMGLGGESQTGLRYKIKFQASGSNYVDSTYITLGGINYLDKIYNLAQGDSIVYPVYNANLNNSIPAGTYGINPDSRLGINPLNGQINLMECMRKGMFDLPVENGEWEEVSVTYKSNDGSNQATNRMDVAIYYYRTINDVPSNIAQVMQAHQKMVLGVSQTAIPNTIGPIDNDLPDNISLTKPRPPCVIVIAQ
jgi:hypothetical protein